MFGYVQAAPFDSRGFCASTDAAIIAATLVIGLLARLNFSSRRRYTRSFGDRLETWQLRSAICVQRRGFGHPTSRTGTALTFH